VSSSGNDCGYGVLICLVAEGVRQLTGAGSAIVAPIRDSDSEAADQCMYAVKRTRKTRRNC